MMTNDCDRKSRNGLTAAFPATFANVAAVSSGPLNVFVFQPARGTEGVFVGGFDGSGILRHITFTFHKFEKKPFVCNGERLFFQQGSCFEFRDKFDPETDEENLRKRRFEFAQALADFQPGPVSLPAMVGEAAIKVPHDDADLLFRVAEMAGDNSVNFSLFRFNRLPSKLTSFNRAAFFDAPASDPDFFRPHFTELFARLELPKGLDPVCFKKELRALCPKDAKVFVEFFPAPAQEAFF